MRHSHSRAFTLIELLVVIAIIAILAAILFPVFAQAKLAAKKTAALSNMKQQALAVNMYLNDSDDMFPEAASGGCTNQATTVNRLWSALIYPYVKSKDLFRDPTASTQWAGFRYDSSQAVPELGLKANDTPCGTATVRGDARSANFGINRQFFSHYICGQDTGQTGCTLAKWEPAPDAASCAPYFTNASRIESTASFVVFAPTTPSCSKGNSAFAASAADVINAEGSTLNSLSSRQGEGMGLGFADGHVKYFRAAADSAIAQAAGSTNARFSPVQNRKAVLARAAGKGNETNGVLNCVNHNAAKVQWSAFVPLPGQNADLDTLCGLQ